MSNTKLNVAELTEELTPEKEAKMARVERLIELRNGLRYDRETALETLNEILEQRREEMTVLEVEISGISEAILGVEAAFLAAETAARSAQFSEMN